MKVNQTKDGVEITAFGANAPELMRDLHDSVVFAKDFSETIFKPAPKKRAPKKKKETYKSPASGMTNPDGGSIQIP